MEEFYHTMHEDLIEQYMKEHPSATLESAIEVTADEAWQCCVALAIPGSSFLILLSLPPVKRIFLRTTRF
jgi:hypothetical protein